MEEGGRAVHFGCQEVREAEGVLTEGVREASGNRQNFIEMGILVWEGCGYGFAQALALTQVYVASGERRSCPFWLEQWLGEEGNDIGDVTFSGSLVYLDFYFLPL